MREALASITIIIVIFSCIFCIISTTFENAKKFEQACAEIEGIYRPVNRFGVCVKNNNIYITLDELKNLKGKN